MCVLYTGGLVTGSYITISDCEATMNDVVAEVDRLLKELKDNDGVLKTTLSQYNCSFTQITSLISATTTTKAKTADVIIAMLRTMCELQTKITTLENKNIYSGALSPTLQLLVNSKTLCLDTDPCDVSGLTLEGLLTKLIYKLCP
jgi:hypothetical protein